MPSEQKLVIPTKTPPVDSHTGPSSSSQGGTPQSSTHPSSSSSWPELLPSNAQHWVVHVLQRGLTDDAGAVFGLLLAEKHRQHLRLGEGAANAAPLTPYASGHMDWGLTSIDGTTVSHGLGLGLGLCICQGCQSRVGRCHMNGQ